MISIKTTDCFSDKASLYAIMEMSFSVLLSMLIVASLASYNSHGGRAACAVDSFVCQMNVKLLPKYVTELWLC